MDMKLYYSSSSPFSRKVQILAMETGLDECIEMVLTKVSPVQPNMDLVTLNPLIKVPILIGVDGMALYDSSTICEYLNTLHDGETCFPADDKRRWTVLRQQALADGILEAAQLARQESALRPKEYQWKIFRDNQLERISRGVASVDAFSLDLESPLTIGSITTICCFGFLDFRLPEFDWRQANPSAKSWFEEVSSRESVTATMPSD